MSARSAYSARSANILAGYVRTLLPGFLSTIICQFFDVLLYVYGRARDTMTGIQITELFGRSFDIPRISAIHCASTVLYCYY